MSSESGAVSAIALLALSCISKHKISHPHPHTHQKTKKAQAQLQAGSGSDFSRGSGYLGNFFFLPSAPSFDVGTQHASRFRPSRLCFLRPSVSLYIQTAMASSASEQGATANGSSNGSGSGSGSDYYSVPLAPSDALPYYDRELEQQPGLKERVDKEIQDELRRIKTKTGDTLHHGLPSEAKAGLFLVSLGSTVATWLGPTLAHGVQGRLTLLRDSVTARLVGRAGPGVQGRASGAAARYDTLHDARARGWDAGLRDRVDCGARQCRHPTGPHADPVSRVTPAQIQRRCSLAF